MAEIYLNGIFRYLADAENTTFMTAAFFASLVLTALVSYVLGSFNFALILSKKMYGEDIRSYGSKNAGTTNMMRTYGKKAALFTVLGDMAKGILAVLFGNFILGAAFGGGYIAGLFCVIGHVFPVFYGFKGGKGVATAAAVILVADPLVGLAIIGVFVLTVLLTRFVSLGSCLAAALFPFLTYYHVVGYIPGGTTAFICAFAMATIVICKHHTNLKRLVEGTESKFSFKKSKPTQNKNADLKSNEKPEVYTVKKKNKSKKYSIKKK